ncbi:MAG: hypothetical protein M3463_08985 [Verrucomicrobiota bacterium]|nr:hypothetical protein [Verrucomicrobiota bacterium]
MKARSAAACHRKQTSPSRKRDYLAIAILLALVIGLYWQTRHFDFHQFR